VIFSYPLHATPPLDGSQSEYCHNVWYGKLEWCGYIQLYFTKHVVAENNKLNKINKHTKPT